MTTRYAILTDVTKCVGCEKCVKACKEENHLGKDVPRRWKGRIDDLSSTRYTTILRRTGGHFVRQQCRHCLKPACVSACIVGALRQTPEGPVIYDGARCMGCRYCMMACPFGIPRYDWERAVPYVRKCHMCYLRIKAGKRPVCVEACKQKATIFGTRNQMLAEARQRIRTHPGKYVHTIYGEKEVGGTSVLYISNIPLGFMGWKKDLSGRPLPDLTWAALSKVPIIALGVGGAMAGIWWVVARRQRLAAEKATQDESANNPNPQSESDQPPEESKNHDQ